MKTRLNIRKLAVFAACLLGFCSVASLAAEPPAKAKKFDLVFLVGVDATEQKVELEAFVEPLFFTDGKKFIFVYDYCRQVMEKKFRTKFPREYKGPHLLHPDEFDDGDREFTLSYCDNKNVSLNGDHYALFNNRAESIRLGKIDFEFSGDGEHISEFIPPTLPKIGRAKIINFPAEAQDSKRISAPAVDFFFAAKSEEVLKKILPTWRINDQEIQPLLRRAIAHGDRQKGVQRAWVTDQTGCPSKNSWCDIAKDERFKNAKVSLAKSLLGDFDGDGKPDVAVGIHAEIETTNLIGGSFAWTATVVMHGDGRQAMVSGSGGRLRAADRGRGLELWGSSYLPLGVFQFGTCKYLLLIETPDVSLRMLNVSGVAARCLDASSGRQLPDPENEYPPH